MKYWIWSLLILVVGGGAGGAVAYKPAMERWKNFNRPKWRTAKVTRGDITAVVNATGEVKPVLSVSVGSFVSGPIVELHVDFNDKVKKDQLLAKIDPRLFAANVDRDKAILASREADVLRVKALLQQAVNNENRALALRAENEDFLSDSELDQYVFSTKSLEAQLLLAKASVDQSQASLENSQANLGYTDIVSPVDGVILKRLIEPGQTLASQFQTPELFIVAPDLRKKMHVFASVDESEIGRIQKAQTEERPVTFTVDAHPDDLFVGEIEQIRISSTSQQNVVTYPVVVAAPNEEMKLLPGMTATISFEVDAKKDAIKIPNAALRFFPDVKQVRKEDRKLLEGDTRRSDQEEDDTMSTRSASERAEARRKRNVRHVWVADGNFLRAIEVETGLIDNRYSEMISGKLSVGDELVTGIKPKGTP